jgi:hypothetical protein
MRNVIQRHSEALRGTQRHSEALKGVVQSSKATWFKASRSLS